MHGGVAAIWHRSPRPKNHTARRRKRGIIKVQYGVFCAAARKELMAATLHWIEYVTFRGLSREKEV